MNGTQSVNQPAFPTIPGGTGLQKFTMEQVDPTALEDDSDSDGDANVTPLPQGLKPGKKTKGRVKIKMEFIENKLRRYTTFSKRKTGIMKKAYELSTLTGTQVMLLVASETGHVYTFATRKLQPMITSESGKALIQTCLNSPDPPPGSHAQLSVDQRMNPTGFEETELTYAVSEEENKLDTIKPVFAVAGMGSIPTSEPGFVQSHSPVSSIQPSATNPVSSALSQSINQSLTSSQLTTLVPSQLSSASITSASASSNNKSTNNMSNMSLQIPNLPPGAVIVPQGTPLIPIQQNGQQIAQQNTSQQTLYRLQNSNQIVSFSTSGTNGLQQQQLTGTSTDGAAVSAALTNVTTALNQVSSGGTQAGTPAMTPGVVMYQTPQGIVYAPTTATLQDRSIFNFQQPATALSLPQTEGGQQIITIPVPVSLTGSPQVLQFATTPATDSTAQVTLSQPTAAKKPRK